MRVSSHSANTFLHSCQADEHRLEGITWSHQLQWAIVTAFLHSTSLMQHKLCKSQALLFLLLEFTCDSLA